MTIDGVREAQAAMSHRGDANSARIEEARAMVVATGGTGGDFAQGLHRQALMPEGTTDIGMQAHEEIEDQLTEKREGTEPTGGHSGLVHQTRGQEAAPKTISITNTQMISSESILRDKHSN